MLTTKTLSEAAQGGTVEQIERVHVVFKTHLDVGFTELPAKVVDRYVDDFFPRAIKLSQELGTGERGFIWTSGSWILSQALGSRTQERRDAVEAAVRNGGSCLACHPVHHPVRGAGREPFRLRTQSCHGISMRASGVRQPSRR